MLQRLALAAACIGYFMVMLDVSIVNVALPSIQQTLGMSSTGLQWTVDGYTLAFASLLLLTGTLSDRIGSKQIFLVGLCVFVLASVLCGAAPTQVLFLLARAGQGVGAALLVPASLTIITHIYPEERSRAGAIGIWGAVSAVAASAGPVVGGFLVQSTGWRTIFFLNAPVGVIGILITFRFVSKSASLTYRSLDMMGQVTGIVALSSLTFAFIQGGALGWRAPVVFLAFLLYVVAASLFLLIEQRSPHPLLPLTLFRSSTFSATTTIGLLFNFSYLA
jgi:DHA2 family methylenomycin A resistance protein-like MFS transporter